MYTRQKSGECRALNYYRTRRSKTSDLSLLFHSVEPSAGSQKEGLGTEFVRRPKSGPGLAVGRLPRPVASWGPRYRYDVDIWRALLLHPRPARSLRALFAPAAPPEWSLLHTTESSLSGHRIFSPLFGPPSVAVPDAGRSCDTVLL
ncbi:hypothetical protein KM043_016344 [Ampulex compressa]|nr:hypothetical protein KM043_016344 [Ampulex compressa]